MNSKRERCRKFEDLIAWQMARKLTLAIYRTTRLPSFSRDVGLTSQMRRASVSVMSNIAEGFERGSQREFYRYLYIARSSCAELRSQLYIACDVGYISNGQFEELWNLAENTARVIGGLKNSVKHTRDSIKS